MNTEPRYYDQYRHHDKDRSPVGVYALIEEKRIPLLRFKKLPTLQARIFP